MEVLCSAPGKVLLAGGYLIVQKQHRGLVISTSSRFYSSIKSLNAQPQDSSAIPVRVISPQFSSESQFSLQFDDQTNLITLINPKAPIYILLSLRVGLAIIARLLSNTSESARSAFLSKLKQGLTITLQADNEFYSQQQIVTHFHSRRVSFHSQILISSIFLVRKSGIGKIIGKLQKSRQV
jgi:phosphomevalonate kinase